MDLHLAMEIGATTSAAKDLHDVMRDLHMIRKGDSDRAHQKHTTQQHLPFLRLGEKTELRQEISEPRWRSSKQVLPEDAKIPLLDR